MVALVDRSIRIEVVDGLRSILVSGSGHDSSEQSDSGV